jgi:hypothetical protein
MISFHLFFNVDWIVLNQMEPVTEALSAGLGGAFSSSCLYPIEICKNRLQAAQVRFSTSKQWKTHLTSLVQKQTPSKSAGVDEAAEVSAAPAAAPQVIFRTLPKVLMRWTIDQSFQFCL